MPVENYPEKKDGEVLSSSFRSPKKKANLPIKGGVSKSKKIIKKTKMVSTMQDDVASLISKKNHPKKGGSKFDIPDKNIDDMDVQRKLTEVYTDGNGEIPDLTRLEITQRPLWKTILYVLIAVFFVLLLVAFAGFLVFSKWDQSSFTNEKITLKIDTPITMVSGQESIYTVIITNKEKVNLYNLELTLFYPENFEYIDSVPVAIGEKNNKWDFSVLKIGETKKIELKGKIIAAYKSNQTFRGTLNFKPENLNATFKQEAIVDVIVSSSVLSLSIDGPEKTLSNQEVEYIIKYENLSEDDFEDIQIVVDYPSGFVFDSAEPESDSESHNTWDLAELKAKESGEIKITGNYSAADSSGNRDFISRIQLKKDNDYYPQNEEIFITEVVKDQLDLQMIINGSAEDQPISFNDIIVYSLNYKNSGEDDLEDIQITVNLDSQILDWNTLKDDNNGVLGNNTITWTGRHISNLLKLGAGEEGQINWSIRVSDASSLADENIGKFSIESYSEAKAQQTGDLSGQSIVRSKIITNSVNSDLDMSAYARYYSEDNMPLGLGPIEPKVGETSTYNIKLELSNNLHDVKDVNFRAKLPANVFWSNRKNNDIGDLSFNTATNEVIWNISNLQRSSEPTEASFNVDITPTDSDGGRILILLSDITVLATDLDTGANIKKDAKAITTAFDDPILGRINGIVQ